MLPWFRQMLANSLRLVLKFMSNTGRGRVLDSVIVSTSNITPSCNPQGNFIETVPLAVILLIIMEVLGASGSWLHALGAALVIGRVLHYIGLTEMGPFVGRPAGIFTTLTVYLVASVWILVKLYS